MVTFTMKINFVNTTLCCGELYKKKMCGAGIFRDRISQSYFFFVIIILIRLKQHASA